MPTVDHYSENHLAALGVAAETLPRHIAAPVDGPFTYHPLEIDRQGKLVLGLITVALDDPAHRLHVFPAML